MTNTVEDGSFPAATVTPALLGRWQRCQQPGRGVKTLLVMSQVEITPALLRDAGGGVNSLAEGGGEQPRVTVTQVLLEMAVSTVWEC